MWKLAHWLFGWDYIQWRNSCDQGVARVYRDGMRRAYYWRYRGTQLADFITDATLVVWLTCEPGKYMEQESPGRAMAPCLRRTS